MFRLLNRTKYFTLIFVTFLFCVLLGSPIVHASDCSWVKNLTDSRDLPHHKYLLLEDCLYYNLSQQSDQTTGKSSSIVLLPPTGDADDKIVINVYKTVLRQMWMNELWHDMTLNGYMTVSWNDYRIKWKPSEWKLDSLNIKTYGQIWVPDVNSVKYQTASQANDFVMFQDIKATAQGNLSARLEYRMQGQCETDYHNYPLDISYCCVDFKSFSFDKLMVFKVFDVKGHLDEEQTQTNWDIKQFDVDSRAEDATGVQRLALCVRAARLSTTLRIELMVPMAISAVIVVISPLFGSMLVQMYVKMFALLLQFLCFQFLVNRTPQAGLGNAVPRIYLFYEFTVAMTLTSLLLTLVLNAFSRGDRSMPPPHRLQLLATAVNNYFCCGGSRGGDVENHATGDAPSGTTYRKDWKELFAAMNNLLSIIVLIVYILGAIVLNA